MIETVLLILAVLACAVLAAALHATIEARDRAEQTVARLVVTMHAPPRPASPLLPADAAARTFEPDAFAIVDGTGRTVLDWPGHPDRTERMRTWRNLLALPAVDPEPAHPLAVLALDAALRASWTADTAYDPTAWTPALPSLGQCAVTALIVQDMLGGTLRRGWMPGPDGGGSHYWNVLPDGTTLDLTADQYGFGVPPSVHAAGVPSERTSILSNLDTRRRYTRLRANVDSHLAAPVEPAPTPEQAPAPSGWPVLTAEAADRLRERTRHAYYLAPHTAMLTAAPAA